MGTIRLVVKCKDCGYKFEHYTSNTNNEKEFCDRCVLKHKNMARKKLLEKVE